MILRGLVCYLQVIPKLLTHSFLLVPGDLAVQLKLHTFNKESVDYPGYDLDIGVKVASLKTVFTNRIVEEVVVYFSAFADIQAAILSATSQVAALTMEVATETTGLKKKLDISVSNPMIIVPRNSYIKDHYLVSFGIIFSFLFMND